MKHFVLAVMFSLVPLTLYAQDKDKPTPIRFPLVVAAPTPAPIPQASPKLTADTLYIVEWDNDFFLVPGTDGLVSIVKESGPLRIRGVFIDGNGKVETRTYKGKVIYIVEAIGTGPLKLIAIPSGLTDEKQMIYKTIDVDNGTGPRPPPPPTPSALAKHVTFIGAELNAAALVVNNDPSLRDMFKNAGIKVHVLKANDPDIAAKGLAKSVEKAGGAPCVVIQDELGNVIGQGPMPSVDAVQKLCSQFIRR